MSKWRLSTSCRLPDADRIPVCQRSFFELDTPCGLLESRSDGTKVDVGFNPRRVFSLPTAVCRPDSGVPALVFRA